MSIDWSKAPADATHFSPAFERFDDLWAKTDGSRWMYRAMNANAWHYGPHPCESESFIERPMWDGEGLPPVGAVCELRAHKLNVFSPAIIRFASRNVFVWDWENEPALNGLCTAYAHDVEIRPIRTAEQIAAIERKKAIGEMIDIYKSNFEGHVADGCQALYDAGWRKQVQP